MRCWFIIFSLLICSHCFAQQWNSESDINNYYSNQINSLRQEIQEAKRNQNYAYSLPEKEQDGRTNQKRMDILLTSSITIQINQQEIARLESLRDSQLNSFRQMQQRMKEKEEQSRRAQQAQQQKQNRQKAQQASAQRKRQQIDRQRQLNEEIARRRAEENARREAERQERIRQEKQRRYNEGYARSMASSARGYERNLQTLREMDNRMEEIRNNHELDGIPRYSGYVSSGSSNMTTKRSKAGILPKRGHVAVQGLYPHATVAIHEWHSDDFKWIDPDRIKPVPSSGKEAKAWDKLRESCSEEKLLMLAHSLKTLNGGSIPSFQGYNDGSLVMYSPASEFDDTQKEKIFVVSPNGGRIFYFEMENHDGKRENILHKMEREEDIIEYKGEISGFGLGASVSKNDDVTDEDNIGFRIGGKDYKLESEGEFAASKVVPKGNVKSELVLVDNSIKVSTKEVFINDYFAIEFGGTVTGGQKVSAEGKLYFDLKEKKEKRVGIKADAGAELFSLGGNAKVSFVKNTKGNTCIVSTEVKAEGGVKPSIMTWSRLFLDGSVDYEATITPINDLKKQIPSNIALAK